MKKCFAFKSRKTSSVSLCHEIKIKFELMVQNYGLPLLMYLPKNKKEINVYKFLSHFVEKEIISLCRELSYCIH